MDLKQYEKVTGHEALIKLLDGERIYNRKGNYWTKKGEGIFVNYEGENGEYESTIPVSWFIDSAADWYVKKPFDVRAEMLARPNEWVGAFRDSKNVWHKIGLDSKYMVAVETRFEEIKPNWNDDRCDMATLGELKKCIPIEDVPEGEWL